MTMNATETFESERTSKQNRFAAEAERITGERPADFYLYSWPSIHEDAPLVFSAAFGTELAALRYHYSMRHTPNIHLRKPGKGGKYWIVSNWTEKG
jgi:hypothetical protein